MWPDLAALKKAGCSNTGKITNGMNADKVLGQTNFTNNGTATTQSRCNIANFTTYDPGSGRLFVSDYNNNRVLIFEGDTNATKAQQEIIYGYE